MAVTEYIKVAAAQIRRAAQGKKMEIDDMRREMRNMESSAGNQLNDLKREERQRQSQAVSSDSDVDKAFKAQEIARLKNEEHDTLNALKDRKNEMNQLISQMETDLNTLNQLASDLDRMAPTM